MSLEKLLLDSLFIGRAVREGRPFIPVDAPIARGVAPLPI